MTDRSPWINILVNPAGELDELAGTHGPARKSNVQNNEAPTLLKAPTSPLVLLPAKNLFTKFMKVFMETTQAQARDQEPLEPQKCPFKVNTLNTYSGKSHNDCYYFCQQCED